MDKNNIGLEQLTNGNTSKKLKQNPFLSGNWSPLDNVTTRDGISCTLHSGTVPRDILGSFVRVGPNPSPTQLPTLNTSSFHFFEGDGLICSLQFQQGLQTCRTRFIETNRFKTGKDEYINADGTIERSGSGNTALVYHAGKLLSLEEGSKPWHVSLPSLDTIGRHDFNATLSHNFTAHPKVCPVTNELIFFGYQFGSETMRYTLANPIGDIDLATNSIEIPFRKPVGAPTPHDLAITTNSSIMLDFPLWNMNGSTKIQDGSLFGVVPRHATKHTPVKWFRTEGQFGYHVANAFETKDNVLQLYVCTGLNFDFRTSNKRTMLLREWKLNLDQGGTQETATVVPGKVLCNIPCEFPVIDERRTGMKFTYIWASRLSQGRHSAPLACNGIVRYNVETEQTFTVGLPIGMHGGECRFVSMRNEDGTRGKEGEGYLILFSHDEEMKSYCLIYNAMFQKENEAPLAVIECNTRVPNGFHAVWVDEEEYVGGDIRTMAKL